MAYRVLAAVLVIVVIGVAVVLAQGDGDAIRGATLYAENCLACHGPQGEARASHEAFNAAIQYDVSFEEVVAAGIEGTFMMGWSEANGGPLDADDLANLRAYAQTWSTGEVPPLPVPLVPEGLVAVGSGDPNAGAALFITNCGGCHGPSGEGRRLAAFPPIDTEADVLTATRRGVVNPLVPNRMPPFAQANGGPLSDQDLANIMAYMRAWDRPTALEVAAAEAPTGVGGLVLIIGLLGIGLVALMRRLS